MEGHMFSEVYDLDRLLTAVIVRDADHLRCDREGTARTFNAKLVLDDK